MRGGLLLIIVALAGAVAFLPTVSAACPNSYAEQGRFCYQFRDAPADWHQAKSNCNNDGGHLIVEVTQQEHTEFLKFRQSLSQQGDPLWIGVYVEKQDTWSWLSDSDFVNYTGTPYQNWKDEVQPLADMGKCAQSAQLNQSTMVWESTPCSLALSYVCEATAIAGSSSTTTTSTTTRTTTSTTTSTTASTSTTTSTTASTSTTPATTSTTTSATTSGTASSSASITPATTSTTTSTTPSSSVSITTAKTSTTTNTTPSSSVPITPVTTSTTTIATTSTTPSSSVSITSATNSSVSTSVNVTTDKMYDCKQWRKRYPDSKYTLMAYIDTSQTKVSSPVACAVMCSYTSGCVAFNHQHATNNCQFIKTKVSETHVSSDTGWDVWLELQHC